MTKDRELELADGIMLGIFGVGWDNTSRHVLLRHTIASALRLRAEEEREVNAKIADSFTCGLCGADSKAGAAIRSRSSEKSDG